jgi:DNA-binding LytR/AlgR family response regulator
MTRPYSCIVVDDDEIDRLTTLSFARKHSILSIEGVYENAEDALQGIGKLKPAVLLLDIDMPGISGLALREKLPAIPACIFITSYADYAVEGFEKDALDFLVKPVKAERFAKAMERLEQYMTLREKASLLDNELGADTIFIKDGHEEFKIHLKDILYLEALKDYTSIVTSNKKYCVHAAMGNLIKEKNFASFVRIHRSYAVQKNFIQKKSATQVMVNDISLPVGRTYKEAINIL